MPSGNVKSDQSERTKTRLLDAAAQLFAARGYRDTSVQAIGAAAGVSRGSIFWHFESKEGLLWALAAREFSRWQTEVLLPTVGDETGVKALELTIESHRRFLKEDPSGLRLFTVLLHEALGPRPEMAPAFAQLHAGLAHIGGGWLSAGIQAGTVREDLQPEVAASLVTAALSGIATQYLLDPDGYAVDAAYDELIRVMVLGMSAQSTAQNERKQR